jgi:hypothetical protein
MIRSPLRAGLALACALSLSACGGSDGNVYVGGTVSGNTKAGLVVTNNDGPRLEIPANETSFAFKELVDTDSNYNVKVVASPDNTTGCEVVKGTGSGKAVFNVTTVRIVCTLKTYPLTAHIVGPHGALDLVNGSDHQPVPADAKTDAKTTVEMKQIPEGAVYGVTLLPSESSQRCTVTNGSGTMTTAGASVDVTCTAP